MQNWVKKYFAKQLRSGTNLLGESCYLNKLSSMKPAVDTDKVKSFTN